jgi:acyl-CoA synthetase (AMP-forming)/AMP-acid ligase II
MICSLSWRLWVVPVPLNCRLAPPEWRHIIDDAQAKLLIAAREYVAAVDEIRRELQTVECFMAIDAVGALGWEDYHHWVTGRPTQPPDHQITADTVLYQMYTSGTTGHPKGAVLTHGAVTANIAQMAVVLKGEPGERCLLVAPSIMPRPPSRPSSAWRRASPYTSRRTSCPQRWCGR